MNQAQPKTRKNPHPVLGRSQNQNPNKNRPKKSKLTSFRIFLLYLSPFILYFSYHPVISLAKTSSTNYELSLALLWLALFSLLSLKDFLTHLGSILKTKKILFYLFPFYLSLSAIWSPNHLRAFLTSGILWCLIISAVGAIKLSKDSNLTTLKKTFLFSAITISIFCWLQCFTDVYIFATYTNLGVVSPANISHALTLLCLGCTSRIFGFPHPSGFAIEPQFMGNLLLSPILYVFYLWLYSSSDIKNSSKTSKTAQNSQQNIIQRIKKHIRPRQYLLVALFLTTTLFLIFSRGAIYSFILALIFLLLAGLIKHKLPLSRLLRSSILCTLSVLLCLATQATFAKFVNKTSPSCAISASVSQLSLNLISPSCKNRSAQKQDSQNQNLSPAFQAPDSSQGAPVFSGYVAESTDVRLSLNSLALKSATKSPIRLLFGTGLGSAGKILYRDGFLASEKEIVQNQYLSLLLESGLLGFALLLLAIITLIKSARPLHPLLITVILAFALSLNFFSGLPNALHLYFFPVLLYLILKIPPSKTQSKRPNREC